MSPEQQRLTALLLAYDQIRGVSGESSQADSVRRCPHMPAFLPDLPHS
jgi:hypothetical protein